MRIDAEEQDILRVEAGIDAVEIVQRSHEKSRADEHDDGKSDLRDHECVAETEAAARVRWGAGERRCAFFQRWRQVDARAAKGGGEAEKNSGGESEDRKSTRLNSSHSSISYAVFCLKKK